MMLCALLFGSVGAAADGVMAPGAPGAYDIVIDSPSNNSYTNVNVVNVAWTVTVGTGLDPYWNESRIFVDGAWTDWYNETDNSSADFGPLADGTYFVNIATATEDAAQENIANVTFTVDTVDPTVEVLFPTDDLVTNDTNFTLMWTADGTGSPLDEFDVTVSNVGTEWVLTVEGDVFEIPVGNVTGGNLPDGEYTVNVTAYDEAGNQATSEDVDFLVTPIVEITFPVDDSYTNLVNFTATWEVYLTDSPLDHFSVNLTNDDTGYFSGWINVGADLSAWITNFTDDNENLTDGNWTLYVNVTDAAANGYIAEASFTVDTVPPEVDFIVPTEDEPYYTNNNSFDAVWEYEVDPLGTPVVDQLVTLSNGTFNVTVSVDPADLGVNVADVWGSELPDGLYTLSVNATDAAGNWYNESVDFTVDTVPPEIDFVIPTEDEPYYTNNNSFDAVWEYEVDPLGTPIVDQLVTLSNGTFNVTVSVDPADLGVNVADLWGDELPDGLYTLSVNATDAAGNWYNESVDFTVDTVDPTLEVTYPDECSNDDNITATWDMDGTGSPIADIVLTITNDTAVEEIFSGSIGAVDNVNFYDLLGYALTDGTYTLEFNVTDEAGNYAIVDYTFDVDLIAPEVEILVPGSSTGPQPVGVGTFTVTFAMEVEEEGCGIDYFDVSVENATDLVWYHDVEIFMIGSLYATNVTLPEDGNYNVTICAIDEAGNNGSDVLWIFVDSAPPMLEITAPTDFYYSQAYMNVTWITSDPDGMMANTTVYLDGVLVSNQSWEQMWYNFTLANGEYTVTVKAHDIAWNEATEDVSFFLDTVQPVVVITAPPASAYLNVSDVEVTWVVSDASPSSGINHTAINIDGGSFIYVGLAESFTFIGVADGPHTVVVMSFDNASNMGSATRSFTVDTSVPVVTISDPSEGAMFAVDVVTVYWNVTEATTSIDHVQYMIDGGDWTDVATNSKEFDALADGLHNVVIRAFDLAMNVGYGFVNFTTDITDPVVTISFPANNAMLNFNTTTVWWNATDATTGIDHCTYSLDGGAAVIVSGHGPQFSHRFINLTDGTHTVLVIAYDLVGNPKSASVTFKVDTHAPTLVITHPVAGAYYNTATIVGTWNVTDPVSGVKQIEVKLDDGAWINIHYNASQSFTGLTTGSHKIYVRATDNVTNVNEKNVTFNIDLVAPTITSFLPAQGRVDVPLRTSISITFSKEMLKTSVSITIVPAPTVRGDPVWTNGNKTVTWYVEFADSTSFTVTAHGTDFAGNAISGTASTTFSSLTWVFGFVVDANNKVLAKANVSLVSTLAGGPTYYTNSSDMGAIGILVPAGGYSIKVHLSGYDDVSKSVTVGPGLAANNLGNVQLSKTIDWTIPIVIVVVGLVAVLAVLFLARRH